MSKKGKDGMDDEKVKQLADYVRKIQDDVTHPHHYMLFPDLEVVDAIVALLSEEEFIGYCKGNILKYRLRAGKKDDLVKDIKKASIYEGWLAECFDEVASL